MVSVRPTVYLFDIDGTLLEGGRSGRRAMERAFAQVTGDTQALRELNFAGMTDPAIVRAGLRVAGHAPADDLVNIDRVLAAYLACLPEEIAATPSFRLHVGVSEMLEEVRSRGSSAVGLGTGNVERGARIKLAPLGVAEVFAFGGFGSDDEHRPTLIGIGADRGCAALGCSREQARVIVIGDTPKDVDAARAIGAECLAVATGGFGVAALEAAGATVVVADLMHAGAIEFLLG